jgi:aminomethyltransferase
MIMGLRTALYDWHIAHGGRMVDFAGWDMPVQYTTIVEEHQAVRTGAGLFDISHMGRLSFGGAGTLELIEHAYTNNASTMKDGQVRYGLICNDRGGIRDDVLVYKWPYGYAMVVNASNREKIIAWLHGSMAGRDVQLVDQTMDTAMVAVQGPAALAMCQDLTKTDPASLKYYFAAPTTYEGQPCVISRTGYTGEDGVEIMLKRSQGLTLWEELIKRGAKTCGLAARDTLRLEAAMPLYGHELSEEIDPIQAGLAWAVKFGKGDFRGKSAILERMEKPRRERIGLELAGKRIAREGSALKIGGNVVGAVTSGTFSPTLNKTIAMAYIEPDHKEAGTEVTVDVRGKDEAGVVVKLPFYKREK